MASFLVSCPQCRSMIAKQTSCPDCHWSDTSEAETPTNTGVLQEFARREGNHKRNYAVFMALMLTTGMASLTTAIMWTRFIFLGSIVAFFWIILLTVFSAGLGVALKLSRKVFPIEFNCPACNVRLDQIGLTGNACPGCNTRLK